MFSYIYNTLLSTLLKPTLSSTPTFLTNTFFQSLQHIKMFISNNSFNSYPISEEVRLAASTPKKPAGRKKFKETRHPVYRGVRKRNLDKWVCEMREPNKKTRIWLGTYPTAEMAARAHDVAAMALRGRYACLNFADSVWRLPVPISTDTKDIQKAATEAAEAFRPDKTIMTNDVDKIVAVGVTEEVSMFCVEVEEDEEELNMADMWRNMALMSPTHSFGDHEYEHINVEDFQDEDEEVFKIRFVTMIWVETEIRPHFT